MGRKPLDLAGKRFGRLTVIGRTEAPEGKGNGNSWWLCKCDCGNTTIVTGIHLKDGKTQSCGCLNQEKRKERFADITGQRFGRLVAIKRLDKRLGGECVWLCKCDCGNFCEVVISNLGKSTLSCGCIKVETLSKDCVDFLGYFKDEDLQKAIDARRAAEEKYFKPLLEKHSNPPREGPK